MTFDDGYKDNYEIALNILEKYNSSAIFFITTKVISTDDFLLHDKVRYLTQNKILPKKFNQIPKKMFLGKKNYDFKTVELINKKFDENKPNYRMMMSASEIKEILKKGFKIGNHTNQHMALPFYNFNEQYIDIKKANDFLFSITNKYPNHFAYPNGLNDDSLNSIKK